MHDFCPQKNLSLDLTVYLVQELKEKDELHTPWILFWWFSRQPDKKRLKGIISVGPETEVVFSWKYVVVGGHPFVCQPLSSSEKVTVLMFFCKERGTVVQNVLLTNSNTSEDRCSLALDGLLLYSIIWNVWCRIICFL